MKKRSCRNACHLKNKTKRRGESNTGGQACRSQRGEHQVADWRLNPLKSSSLQILIIDMKSSLKHTHTVKRNRIRKAGDTNTPVKSK